MATKKPPWEQPRTTDEVEGLDPLFMEPTFDRPAGLARAPSLDEATDDLAGAVDLVRSRPNIVSPAIAPPPEPSRLEFQSPDGTPNTRLLNDATTIGRHTDNDIQLLDPEVSKAHLVIRRAKEGYVLEDLGSANGTLVNGVRQHRVRLQEGDLVVVGNSTLRYKESRPRSRPPSQSVRPPMRGAVEAPALRAEGNRPKPLSSFAEVRRSDTTFDLRTPPIPMAPQERTSVTLVPEGLLSDIGSDNVFTEQPEPGYLDLHSVQSAGDDRALRRDYERLKVAFDLFTGIGLETDLETLGTLILEKIQSVHPCDSAVIMLRDATISDDLVALSSYSEKNQPVNIPRAIVDRVLSTKTGLLTSDAQVDSQLRRSETIVGARIRSAMCVPLVVRDEVLGVIHLSSTSLTGAYGERDLALLRAIAQPAALAVANARLRLKIEQEAATRAELSRFLSPALVEKAVHNELDFTKAGDLVQATVLFSDIRGFTSISDGAAPERVVSMLNEYFDAMVEVVFEYGGTLDKFLGDGLMAVWGTPMQAADDAVRAVQAANEMRKALRDIVNSARLGRGEMPLAVGYGIATGRVIAGAMGARRRLDFTVIGDTVNLSSRLCSQASPGQLLIDETTAAIIGAAGLPSRALEARNVKGFARPVPVFDVDDDESAANATASMEIPVALLPAK